MIVKSEGEKRTSKKIYFDYLIRIENLSASRQAFKVNESLKSNRNIFPMKR